MSTQVDLSEHKVIHDERVKERNRVQRLLIRPEMGALIGAVAIFIFFAIVAPPFRSPEALATVLYASSTIVGAALYLVLERAGTSREAAALVGMGTIVVVRFVAILWRLELPVLSLEETHTGSFRRQHPPGEP